MEAINISLKSKHKILALGAESAGNFSAYRDGKIWSSRDFGDLLDEKNFKKYKCCLKRFLDNNTLRPDIIISDLHPEFCTTKLAKELSRKYRAEHLFVQHHLAHVFSSIGDSLIFSNFNESTSGIPKNFTGIACDGTGLGTDGNIWGGEVFRVKAENLEQKIARIGHLENQTMIGGELAIRKPAQVLIAILSKFLNREQVHGYVRKYYPQKEFGVICKQFEQEFNCVKTSSTARIFDAASVLLGFSKNERLSKHAPAIALEKNSTMPYRLKPVMTFSEKEDETVLRTTPLFEFLIKNIKKDKRRLAATVQTYIAEGLLEIAGKDAPIFFSGGMATNAIMRHVFKSRCVYVNKKIPCSDAGISFGQTIFHLLTDPRNHLPARHFDRTK